MSNPPPLKVLDDVEAALDLINELDGVMALDKLVGTDENHAAYKEVLSLILEINQALFSQNIC